MMNGAPQISSGFRLERRIEAHELAVAVGHEGENRIVALAGDQHFAHLAAQIRGEFDVRSRRSIRSGRPGSAVACVMCSKRACSAGSSQLAVARPERRRRDARASATARQRPWPSAGAPSSSDAQLHAPPRRAAAMRGRNSCSHTSVVIGEMNLYSTRPLPSTRKVSGAPYTPQSIAVRPSVSKATAVIGIAELLQPLLRLVALDPCNRAR